MRGIMNLQKVMSTPPNKYVRVGPCRSVHYYYYSYYSYYSSLYINYYYHSYSSSTTHFAQSLLSAMILQNHIIITGVFVYFDFFLSWRF